MTDTEQKSTGMALWLRLVLFASLALNLLIVGLVVGAVLRGGPERGAGGPRDRDFAAPYARALTPDVRRDLSRSMRREMRAARPERGAISQGYRDASAAMRAEPFDPAALESILGAQAKGAQARHAIGQKVLLGYLSQMSADERAVFADRLDAEIDRLAERSRQWGKRD